MINFIEWLLPGLVVSKERKIARELMTTVKHLPGQHDQLSHGGRDMAPSKDAGEGSDTGGSAPLFENYDDARDWMEQESKKYSSKNEFYASDQYRKAYPLIDDLYKSQKRGYVAQAKTAMDSVGVKPGDRVTYTYLSPFMGSAETYTGILILRDGIPFVKLDPGQQTMSGGKSSRWHKGWTRA